MADSPALIVTGGARGIGRGIVLGALSRGHHVTAADVDGAALDELQTLAASGSANGGTLLCVHCDVTNEADVARAVAEHQARFGRLDGLVNNAAIADPSVPPLETLSLDAWRKVLATNLDSVFLCTKHAVAALRRAKGAIVNVASTRAVQSEPNTEAYAASKGGVVALTHALALSLGPQVRVNCVSPGWIDTSEHQPGGKPAQLNDADHAQHPVGRVGRPRDVANLVLYLLSDDAGFITGQNFVVDGGMTKKMIYVD